MQKKRSNSPLKITDLSPILASELFSFIKELIESHHLDLSYFQKKHTTLHPGQKYFIDIYLKNYLNYFSSNSYISVFLKRQEKYIEHSDINKASFTQNDFDSLKTLIKSNSQKILDICERDHSLNKRMFRLLLNSNQSTSSDFDFTNYLVVL